MRLQDKVAIITGAGSGQGEASSFLFANEGAKVVVAEWNEEAGSRVARKIVDQGGDAFYIKVDVSKEDRFDRWSKRRSDITAKSMFFLTMPLLGIRQL